MPKEKKEEIILKPKEAVKEIPEQKELAKLPVEDDKGEIVKLIHTAGTVEFTKEQRKILFAPVVEEDVEIRQDGLIYLPWMEYVTRLRDAFSGKWAIVPVGKPSLQKEDELILQEYWLLLDGCLYGKAIGEQRYFTRNDTMSWGDAMEGCKSNGLMRLCKGIGIGLELWKPTFIRNWKKKYAESYYDERKGKYLWRKIDPEAKKEAPKKTATSKSEPIKKKAPAKPKEEAKPLTGEDTPEPESPKEEEILKPEIVYATEDQKNAIRSLQNTIVDDYGDDAKELEKKMIAGIKKRFKRTVKDIYEDTSEEEGTFLIKSLNLTVQDRHSKLREQEEPEVESL